MFLYYNNEIVRVANLSNQGVEITLAGARVQLDDVEYLWERSPSPELSISSAAFICPGCQRRVSMHQYYALGPVIYCSAKCLRDVRPGSNPAPLHAEMSPLADACAANMNAAEAETHALAAGAASTNAIWQRAWAVLGSFQFTLASIAMSAETHGSKSRDGVARMLTIAAAICVNSHNMAEQPFVVHQLDAKRPLSDQGVLNAALGTRVANSVVQSVAHVVASLIDHPDPAALRAARMIADVWNGTLPGRFAPYNINVDELIADNDDGARRSPPSLN